MSEKVGKTDGEVVDKLVGETPAQIRVIDWLIKLGLREPWDYGIRQLRVDNNYTPPVPEDGYRFILKVSNIK